MAGNDVNASLIDNLKIVEEHAHNLVEPGKRRDWEEARSQLRNLKLGVLAVSHGVVSASSDRQ